MNNLELYNFVRQVPQEAIKTIQAGNLKGYSDINPMWRIKTLTELFGTCGVGWYYDLIKYETLPTANGEIAMLVTIMLYIKQDNEWSKGIVGVGGSMLVNKFKNGLTSNDEALKMATTDAISVACKQLGIGADVYWEKDSTKYSDNTQKKQNTAQQNKQSNTVKLITAEQGQAIQEHLDKTNMSIGELLTAYKITSLSQLPESKYPALIKRLKELASG